MKFPYKEILRNFIWEMISDTGLDCLYRGCLQRGFTVVGKYSLKPPSQQTHTEGGRREKSNRRKSAIERLLSMLFSI